MIRCVITVLLRCEEVSKISTENEISEEEVEDSGSPGGDVGYYNIWCEY